MKTGLPPQAQTPTQKRKPPNLQSTGLDVKEGAEIIADYVARQAADLVEDSHHVPIYESTACVEVPVDLVPQVSKRIFRRTRTA